MVAPGAIVVVRLKPKSPRGQVSRCGVALQPGAVTDRSVGVLDSSLYRGEERVLKHEIKFEIIAFRVMDLQQEVQGTASLGRKADTHANLEHI